MIDNVKKIKAIQHILEWEPSGIAASYRRNSIIILSLLIFTKIADFKIKGTTFFIQGTIGNPGRVFWLISIYALYHLLMYYIVIWKHISGLSSDITYHHIAIHAGLESFKKEIADVTKSSQIFDPMGNKILLKYLDDILDYSLRDDIVVVSIPRKRADEVGLLNENLLSKIERVVDKNTHFEYEFVISEQLKRDIRKKGAFLRFATIKTQIDINLPWLLALVTVFVYCLKTK